MNVKNRLLSHTWLIGLSNASFVFAGFFAGRGDALLAVSLGVLATGMTAMTYAAAKQDERIAKDDAYAMGLAHGQRRTASRR